MNPWILLNKYIFVKFEKKTMTRIRFKKLIYPSGFVALIYLGIWHVKRERSILCFRWRQTGEDLFVILQWVSCKIVNEDNEFVFILS